MEDLKKHVETLIEKAARAHGAADALHYSQAALNAANAICSLGNAKSEKQ
jgi:hypothetical protein